MYGMNRILTDIGWAAVAVDGLYSAQCFMEFQAYNVLVIARISVSWNTLNTHRPDIIHEGAMRLLLRTLNMQNTCVVLEK
jgi:phenylalanine-4-hydroxylase